MPKNSQTYAMSKWQGMQDKPNTKLRDLLKSKKAKIRKLSELSKIEQNRLAKLNGMLNELRRGKNVQTRRLALPVESRHLLSDA